MAASGTMSTITLSNGATASAYVQVKQPYASTTTNCQILISLTTTSSTDIEAIVTATSNAISGTRSVTTMSNSSGTTKTSSYGWSTVNGLSCNTGSTTFTVTFKFYSDNGSTQKYIGTGSVTFSGYVYWTDTTHTPCSPPTIVRVGPNTSYSSNYQTYNTTAPTPGQFYITWNQGTLGNIGSISGYERKADGSAYGGGVHTNTTAPNVYYDLSYNWLADAVGKTYKCTVRTLNSNSTYSSDWSSSYGNVVFSAAATSRTVYLDANGGTHSKSSVSGLEGNVVDCGRPTRLGYSFGGWYYPSTASNCLDYGTIHNYTSSFSVSFWTYASTYAQGSRATPVSIVSSAEGAGWCLSCEDGVNWAFELWDGSRWCEALYARANISAGRHYWCLVFDSSAGIIKMYIDGSQKASASVPNKKVVYGSSNHLLLGAELGASNRMESGSGFAGYIGNFTIENTASVRTYDSTEFTVPTENIDKLYAYWSKISGKIYYNAGQYFTGSANNPQPDMGTIKSGYTMQSYGGHYGFAANSSGTLESPNYDIESTAININDTTTYFNAPPGCIHSPVATQWKIWDNTEGKWISTAGVSAASWNVGSLVSNGTIVAGDELIAFANWLPNTYTLTFDPNGGICSTTTKTVTYGTTYTDLPTATKEGYIFKGWTANFNGSSDFINYGRRYMFTNSLSAHFSAYMDDWSNYSTVGMKLASCTETGGWAFQTSSENIQNTAYDYGVGYKGATASTAWASLSSGWHDFDSVFDGSTLKLYVDRNLLATSSAFSSSRIGYHNTNSILIGAEAGATGDTSAGNYFNGKIGNVIILNSSTLQNATYNSFTAPAQDITLYAIWEQTPESTVTYVLNGGTYNGSTDDVTQTVDAGSNIVLINPTPYNLSGHIIRFKGWYLTTSGGNLIGRAGDTYKLNSDTILYALYYDTELNAFIPHFVYVYDETNDKWQKVIPYIYTSADDSWKPSGVYIYLENN